MLNGATYFHQDMGIQEQRPLSYNSVVHSGH